MVETVAKVVSLIPEVVTVLPFKKFSVRDVVLNVLMLKDQ